MQCPLSPLECLLCSCLAPLVQEQNQNHSVDDTNKADALVDEEGGDNIYYTDIERHKI